jgi:hypothetical protein
MRRVTSPRGELRRGPAWFLFLVALSTGCKGHPESSAAAATRAFPPIPSAVEWIGERAATEEPRADPVSVPHAAWVLHVGDSFVDASLKQNLVGFVHAAGTRYIVRSTTASYTTTWAYSVELDRMLASRPSLVIVTLGANEFDIPVPGQHAKPVEIIARKIARSGAACVWTSPPMWRPDTGIVQVIRDHCAPCLFFDSDAILGGLSRAERTSDHIHPNRRGGARWAEALWGWIGAHRDPARGGWGLVPFEPRAGERE